jgi:hypothetical protein
VQDEAGGWLAAKGVLHGMPASCPLEHLKERFDSLEARRN